MGTYPLPSCVRTTALTNAFNWPSGMVDAKGTLSGAPALRAARNLSQSSRPNAGRAAIVTTHVGNYQWLLKILGKHVQAAAVALDRRVAKHFIARAVSLVESGLEHSGDDWVSIQSLRGRLAPWQVSRVKAHIEANLDSALRVHDIARIAKLGPSGFCRAFKSSFGERPHAYVSRRKVARAQEMMLTTEEPLSQIALACGYWDQAHFSRVFRRVVGRSPNEWRRQRQVARDLNRA